MCLEEDYVKQKGHKTQQKSKTLEEKDLKKENKQKNHRITPRFTNGHQYQQVAFLLIQEFIKF